LKERRHNEPSGEKTRQAESKRCRVEAEAEEVRSRGCLESRSLGFRRPMKCKKRARLDSQSLNSTDEEDNFNNEFAWLVFLFILSSYAATLSFLELR